MFHVKLSLHIVKSTKTPVGRARAEIYMSKKNVKSIQLDLFSGQAITPAPEPSKGVESLEVSAAQVAPSQVDDVEVSPESKNPCPSCPLFELCGDECGMLLHPVDVKYEPRGSFAQWSATRERTLRRQFAKLHSGMSSLIKW